MRLNHHPAEQTIVFRYDWRFLAVICISIVLGIVVAFATSAIIGAFIFTIVGVVLIPLSWLRARNLRVVISGGWVRCFDLRGRECMQTPIEEIRRVDSNASVGDSDNFYVRVTSLSGWFDIQYLKDWRELVKQLHARNPKIYVADGLL